MRTFLHCKKVVPVTLCIFFDSAMGKKWMPKEIALAKCVLKNVLNQAWAIISKVSVE